jgi:hypothetical protein
VSDQKWICGFCGEALRVVVDDAPPYTWVTVPGGSAVCEVNTTSERWHEPAREGEGDPEPEVLKHGSSPLVDAILQQGERDSAWVAKVVDRDYREQIARLKARIKLTTDRIYALYDGDYVPSQDRVLRALSPSVADVTARMIDDGWRDED